MRVFTVSFALAVLLPALSYAQNPALLSITPARHSYTASRTGSVQLTFSRAVAAPAGIRLNTTQRQGQRLGTTTGAGTALVAFQPTHPFAPGEQVSVTVPASVSSPAQVVEFRAAAGRGTATFGLPYTVGAPLNPQPSVSAAGDFDQDGDLDLLVVNYGASTGQVCLNNGSGQFAAQPATVPLNSRALSLRLADINGDGNLDAISYTVAALGGGVAVNLGTGQGTFLPKIQLGGGYTATTGDFNADGIVDIVTGSTGGTNALLGFVPGNTAGIFNPTTLSPTSIGVQDLAAVDMDEDGDLDLLVNSGTQLGVYLNNGSGQFTASPVQGMSISQNYGGIAVGDFNGDGHADVVSPSYNTSDITLVLGTGTGSLQLPQAISALSRTRHVSSGDLDGDGDLDLLVTNDRGITQTLLNNGQGRFSAASAVLIGFEPFNFAEAADLNGDGSLDIYTGHSTSNPSLQHGLDIFFNQPPAITAAATARARLAFTLAPNPTHGPVALTLPAGSGAAVVELRDALGRLVQAWPAQLPAASGQVLVSVAGLPAGVYVVQATTATHRGVQRVVVQ